MPAIPLPWQIVIVASVIIGITLLLTLLGRESHHGRNRGPQH